MLHPSHASPRATALVVVLVVAAALRGHTAYSLSFRSYWHTFRQVGTLLASRDTHELRNRP